MAEEIPIICTLKKNAFLSNEQASLFIVRRRVGGTYGREIWYQLTPSGIINKFERYEDIDKLYEEPWGDIL